MAVSLGLLARALQPHALTTCMSLQDWGHPGGGGSPANRDPQELPGEPRNPSAAAPWHPGWSPVQNSWAFSCGRPGFDPWVGKMPWRRTCQPTPVLLPGESHALRSLVGYNPQSQPQLKQLSMQAGIQILRLCKGHTVWGGR